MVDSVDREDPWVGFIAKAHDEYHSIMVANTLINH